MTRSATENPYAQSWVSKLHAASWARTDALHWLHVLADREAAAEAQHRATLAAIRRQAELRDARRALDAPTVELPVVVHDNPDREDGPAGPPPAAPSAPVPADVARMASDLRTDADRAGPSGWSTPSAKELRRRFGIGHGKAVAVLDELDRTTGRP